MELQGAQQTTGGASAKVLGVNYFLRLLNYLNRVVFRFFFISIYGTLLIVVDQE